MTDTTDPELDRAIAEALAVVGTVAWLAREGVPEAMAWECCLTELGNFLATPGRTLNGCAAAVEAMKRNYLWGFRSNGIA